MPTQFGVGIDYQISGFLALNSFNVSFVDFAGDTPGWEAFVSKQTA
ncbi:MAG TPA: hypothetical protein VFC58_06825 [Desulfosporosinus sp.]|nr:hypothetical protein [Desulfosporosinus sp.]